MLDFTALLKLAVQLGADDAALITVTDIVVKDELATLCREPRCEGLGNSLSCPPYVGGLDPPVADNLVELLDHRTRTPRSLR